MDQKNNILYIPIQINGGDTADVAELLERELYIKDKILYVGPGHIGTDKKTNMENIIIGRVVPGAIIDSATLTGKLMLDSSLIKTKEELRQITPESGQIFFVDEGKGYN